MSLVKEIRGAEGLSQIELGEITGYGRRTIQRKEAMHLPEPEFMAELAIRARLDVERIAKVYGMKAEQTLLFLCSQRISPLH